MQPFPAIGCAFTCRQNKQMMQVDMEVIIFTIGRAKNKPILKLIKNKGCFKNLIISLTTVGYGFLITKIK
jgi:hypothetical protein